MTGEVEVYGFGSAFGSGKPANDIDLLIVHHGHDLVTCRFAIACKRQLKESIRRAHITMLSDTEEACFEFIKTARAVSLGVIRYDQFDRDVAALGAALPKLDAI